MKNIAESFANNETISNFAAHFEDVVIKQYNKLNYDRSSIKRRRKH